MTSARIFRLLLIGLVLSLGYGNIMGKGGWMRKQNLAHQLALQQAVNLALEKRNQGLRAEVADLKSGSDAMEERARSELGMVREGEVYYQYWSGSGH
ncbi:MAG: cell division protein FtsB [Ferrovum sp.]|nr:cell division protein FtsB [Ferrovum sp.]NDU87239.1 cell division protein FtsB [Ferrovum sp.]